MNERRRYFRVTDEVGLACRLMPEAPVPGASPMDRRFAEAEMLKLESAVVSTLETLRASQPAVHELLELFNRKINLALSLGKSLAGDDEGAPLRHHEVSLSACGIGFKAASAWPVGSLLQLDMMILSSNLRLRLATVVVGCEQVSEPHETPLWLVRGDFVNMEEEVQEMLVQHVMKRQSVELRRRREARERGDEAAG